LPTSPLPKISLLLNGGMNDRADPELVAPVVATGTAPDLLQSVNTRLSVVPGSVVRSPGTTTIMTAGSGVNCYGVVACQAGKSAVAFFSPDNGFNRQIREQASGYTAGILRAAFDQTTPQTRYRPVQIASAGAIPASPALGPIATAYNTLLDQIWYAYMAANPLVVGGQILYAYATDSAGVSLCSPVQVVVPTLGASTLYVGLTAHGNNGVSVWYQIVGSGLKRIPLTLSSNQVLIGAVDAVATPAATNGISVCRIDDTFAAVTSSTAGSVNDGSLRVYNVATSAVVTAITLAGTLTGADPYTSVHSETIAGTTYVAASFSGQTGVSTSVGNYTWNGTGLTNVWTTTKAVYGTTAVKFLSFSAQKYAVFAVSDYLGSFGSGTTLGTSIYYIDVTTGITATTTTLPWQNILNAGAQVTIGAELYPLFFVVRVYGQSAGPTLLTDYVDDPSVEAYLCHGIAVAPVARFGTVRGTVAPARVNITYDVQTNGACAVIGTQIICAYRKDNFGNVAATNTGYYGRYVQLDFGARQPSMIQDRDGTALAAAALPFQWDGVEVTEVGGPLHSPHLAMATGGGHRPPHWRPARTATRRSISGQTPPGSSIAADRATPSRSPAPVRTSPLRA
jgi:hypothetical protein